MPFLKELDMEGVTDNWCATHEQPRWVCRRGGVLGSCLIGTWPRVFVSVERAPELALEGP